MPSFVFTPAKTRLFNGSVNLADVRVALVMTNTTADTEQDAENVADLTTLDEMDGANYTRASAATETVTEDAANNRAEFTFDPVVFTALGNGTRQLEGILLIEFVDGTAANDLLLAFIDPTGWPINPGGADLTITPNAEGVLQAT